MQDFTFQELPYLDLLTGTSPQKITDDEDNEVTTEKTCIKIEPGDVQSCLVGGQIDEIEPLSVGAGVLQQNSLVFDADSEAGIITIRGCGFDDLDETNFSDEIPNNYRVEFQAAESNNRVSPFASDYILWDDDEIQVRVPSTGYRVNFFGLTDDPMFDLVAGNGTIRIRKPGLFSNINSDDELTVRFAHWNDAIGDNTDNHEAVRLRLKAFDHPGDPAANDGYEFFFTQAFIDNMPAGSVDAVTDALEEWRCRVRVNFEIVDEDDIDAPINLVGAGPIDWGDVEAGLLADSKTVLVDNLIDCSNGDPSPDFPPRRLGFIFSDSEDFSANGAPANNEHDVQTIALHEFGHNVLLAHVDNNEATMFPDIDPGAGGIDHDLDGADISGGQHVVNVSTEAIDCPPALPPMVPLGPCLNSTDDLLRRPDFAIISPNPNDGGFSVAVKDALLPPILRTAI